MKITFQRLLLIATLVCGLSAIGAAQDDETIKVDTNLIVINAVVTDSNGKPAAKLKQTDFQILEDGKLQQIQSFGAESTNFAAVVLIDTSGSMETRLPLARSAAIKFLAGMRGDDAAAVYHFDSKVKLVQEFSNSRDLTDSAFNLKADGTTVLNDAVIEAAKLLNERAEKRRAIIVLSDGADTSSKASQSKALQAALRVNAVIYTVDMSAIDKEDRSTERRQAIGALKTFADKSGGRFVAVAGGQELRQAFAQIVQELTTQYTLAYEPKDVPRDGKWHTIAVQINTKPNLQVRARKGYNAPKK